MADKKDSPGSSGSKGTDKPDNLSDPSKKPKPILDLKATEVRGSSSASTGKPAPTSGLKGAPDWKTSKDKPADNKTPDGKPADDKTKEAGSQASTRSTTTGSKPQAGSGSVRSSMSSLSNEPTKSSSAASSGTSNDKSADATKPATTASPAGTAAKSGGASSATSSKPSASSSSSGPSGTTSAPSPARSGGGFFPTLSHLAAGIIGGGIALFAIEPVGKQFGLDLAPTPKVPAALVQRIASLEAKQAGGVADRASRQDVEALSGKIAAAEKRLAEIDKLSQQVASLAGDVAKVQSAAPARAPGASSTTASSDEQTAALRTRLAKLESALATLTSATDGKGRPTGTAQIAQFSSKFADLESSLGNQIASLRKNLMAEVDKRLEPASAAASKAVTGTERLDREMADLKTDAARLEQRATVLKAAGDKLSATVRALSEQAANFKVELDSLKGDLTQQLAKVVRPKDVQAALEPVSQKVAAIEKNLGSVLASETARKQNAERIVLSLELSNLKRVLDRGAPYERELADVKKIAGDTIDFASLEAHKSTGVPSGQDLTQQFRKVAYQIIHAEDEKKDASRIERLLSAAKSMVQIRRTDVPATEKTAEATVARIEKHLKDGDMSGALAIAEKLPEQAKAPAKEWISKLAARAGVDRAIAKIEGQLKASLGAAPAAGDKKS